MESESHTHIEGVGSSSFQEADFLHLFTMVKDAVCTFIGLENDVEAPDNPIDIERLEVAGTSNQSGGSSSRPVKKRRKKSDVRDIVQSFAELNGTVDCIYASSGCKEKVVPGTIWESDHTQSCEFRPLNCIVNGCREKLLFSSFLIHLHQHLIYPLYGTKMSTSIIIHETDFKQETKWSPKWVSFEGRHFFLMLERKEPGYWFSWVWFFGNESDAEIHAAKITLYKGNKCISGIYPIHSIRKTEEEVREIQRGCLITSDEMLRAVCQQGNKLVTDIAVNVQIIKWSEMKAAVKQETSDSSSIFNISVGQDLNGNMKKLGETVFSAMKQVSNFVQEVSESLTPLPQ